MSELPPSELASRHVDDVNAGVKRRQILKYSIVLAVIAIPLCWFVYGQLEGPNPGGKRQVPVHVAATGQTAAQTLNETPVDEAEAEARDAQTRLADAEHKLADLQTQNDQLKAQQAADRVDATHTITALSDQIGIRGGAPAPTGRSASALGSAPGLAPPPGALPTLGGPSLKLSRFQSPRSGELTPTAADAPVETDQPAPPPARTLQTIRAGEGVAPTGEPPSGQLPPPAEAARGAAAAKSYFSSKLEVFDSDAYVPPNAYAEATVLVGVDAATGTTYSQDPKPVLMRILGPATHVGVDGKFQTTDLTGCLINGAAYAELPSEKVYIKLQKITCPAGPGKFSVATVEGYVTSKGKAGVRGQVISREGTFTTKALVAGTLNGLGSALSKNVQAAQSGIGTSVGTSGVLSAEQLTPQQIATGSIGTGVSQAAAMLADYYIKRAEQYQPVIEMPTGIQVEIVFLSGFQIK